MDPALEELGNLARDEGLYIHAGNTGNTGGLLSSGGIPAMQLP